MFIFQPVQAQVDAQHACRSVSHDPHAVNLSELLCGLCVVPVFVVNLESIDARMQEPLHISI